MTTSEKNLEELLAGEQMLTLADVAEKLDLPITRVHDLMHARKFIAWRNPEHPLGPGVVFQRQGRHFQARYRVITVLSDGGYDDEAILAHLFTEDDSLPGRPIDGLHGAFGARGYSARAGDGFLVFSSSFSPACGHPASAHWVINHVAIAMPRTHHQL
ncbi:Hypothetical protein NG00_01439 [Corynebacterium camporealensis]|nr:Hypothetical protein NG00_01439 [Corynebacterium camporealensis]